MGRRTVLSVRVASLLARPRDLPPAAAEAAYRQGESLALGLDAALSAAGIKRTTLIGQRVNRVAFSERWPLPGTWADFVRAITALPERPSPGSPPAPRGNAQVLSRAVFPHLLDHAGSPWYYVPREFPAPLRLPEPRPQLGEGGPPAPIISVGSVPVLARELEDLEPLLAARGLEPAAWFPALLLEAGAVSLETGLVVIVSMEDGDVACP